jgi:hypothetical protein
LRDALLPWTGACPIEGCEGIRGGGIGGGSDLAAGWRLQLGFEGCPGGGGGGRFDIGKAFGGLWEGDGLEG